MAKTEQPKKQPDDLNLSEAYRQSRRTTSILCGMGLAWSVAQFDLHKITLGDIAELDLSRASIPLILGAGIIYSFIRNNIDYAMQSKGVRRWSLAHLDYKLTLNLVRGSFLMMAVSQISRSFEAAIVAAISVISFFLASLVFVLIGTLTLMYPIYFFYRGRFRSKLAYISRAWHLSLLALPALPVLALLLAAFVKPEYSFLSIFPTPSLTAAWLITAVSTAIVVSYICEEGFTEKLFALIEVDTETGRTTVYFPDSKIQGVIEEESSPRPPVHLRKV